LSVREPARVNAKRQPAKPDMDLNATEIVDAFLQTASLAGVALNRSQVRAEFLSAPHTRPSSLPVDCQAVYTFLIGGGCLKVGKAGPKTQARFTSQHYGANAPSTLAKSIIADRRRMLHLVPAAAHGILSVLDIDSIGSWLEDNTSRFHLFLPSSEPSCVLALAEAFLQCRLRPVYEGKGM
jgi:hypothetical protein